MKIIEDAVAKSKFHDETAVFVAAPARVLVISPWAKATPPNMAFNPFSALRTIEIILGLRPMTIFDASAKPMFDAFATPPPQ